MRLVTGVLSQLADRLTQEDASVAAIAAAAGGAGEDHGSDVDVEAPAIEGVERLQIARAGGDSDTPSSVVVTLSQPLALDELAAHLGEPRRVEPDQRGEPARLVHPTPIADRGHPIVVIAREDGEGTTRTITLRRD